MGGDEWILSFFTRKKNSNPITISALRFVDGISIVGCQETGSVAGRQPHIQATIVVITSGHPLREVGTSTEHKPMLPCRNKYKQFKFAVATRTLFGERIKKWSRFIITPWKAPCWLGREGAVTAGPAFPSHGDDVQQWMHASAGIMLNARNMEHRTTSGVDDK